MNEEVWHHARDMSGGAAVPRDNGALVFEAPWEGRVLAMAVGLVQQLDLDWDEFRVRLTTAISERPVRPYYESWTAALEALVTDLGLAEAGELAQRATHIEP